MSPHSIKLNNGLPIPPIAYGSGTAWFGADGPDGISAELKNATETALRIGYTHLDAAQVYKNERSVGAAIEGSGIKRDELFITTKIIYELKNLKETLKNQLRYLRVDYVDLYLIHSPMFASDPKAPSLQEAWRSMEDILDEGLAKSIGVSNYRIKDLEETLKSARVKPSVNQIELHPYVWSEAEPLVEFMKKEGIALAAYGPQAPVTKHPGGKAQPILERLAKEHDLTTGQVCLKWAKAHGAIVVTTSGKEERMKLNLETVMDDRGDLTVEEVQELDRAGKENGVFRVFMHHMSE